MTPERVLTAMESGAMLSMASGRTGVERRAIAEFVTGKTFADRAQHETQSPRRCAAAVAGEFANPLTGPRVERVGRRTRRTRDIQEGTMAGLTAGDVPKLKLKWAFGFPGELSADGQPSMAGGRVFVGTQSGTVYALSASTGCVHWTFQADAAVRAAITIARSRPAIGYVAFVGDRAANVYALDATTGAMIWKSHVDDHPFARVTASPTFHNGRLYVGVASGEETAGAVAEYECCTFRGSLVVLDACDRIARLEDVHDRGTAATGEEPNRHAAVGPVGRADLVEPGDRCAEERGLRDDRQQLQRPGHGSQRRLRRVRSGVGEDPVVPSDDGV